jgi:hypothetical protein
MASSLPISDPLEAAVLAAAKAAQAAATAAKAVQAAAALAEETAAWACASQSAAELALSVAKPPPAPPVGISYPKANCSARGEVAMRSRATGHGGYTAAATAKNTARVAAGGAREAAVGMTALAQSLRAATLVAETAEAAAHEAAEAALVWLDGFPLEQCGGAGVA